LSLHQFLLALRARAKTFALVLAATVLATALVSMVLPKTYVATTAVVVDKRDEQSLTSGASRHPREQAGYLQTQVDVLTSQKVARKVANDLGLTRDEKTMRRYQSEANGEGSIDDWVAAQLLKRLKTDTSQSSVIQVMYSGPDAKQAAEVANAFTRAYLETTLELRTEPTREAAAWFNDQVKELRGNLERSQAKLVAYQKEKGIFASDERFDIESARLSELSTQLLQAQNMNYEASTRRRHAQGASLASMPEVMANPVIQQLTSDVARSESRLTELGAYLGPAHPQYQRQQSEARALRARLASEVAKIGSGLETAARQQSEREADLKNALAAQRTKVLSLKESRNEVNMLARDVETAQRMYDSALQRYVVNKVDSQARQTNIAVLTPAIAPSVPTHPKIALNVALALVVGMMLGLSVVYMMETIDARVRSRGDLEMQLNLPMLAVLDGVRAGAGRRLMVTARAPRALPRPA
jgi:polysaccharide biosynthesis transport protein